VTMHERKMEVCYSVLTCQTSWYIVAW